MRGKMYFAALFIVFLFFGCAGSKEIESINYYCADDCNEGNAVWITIFQLKSENAFLGSGFESSNNPCEKLGVDCIVDTQIKKRINPGKNDSIYNYKIMPEAHYIGIFADFYYPVLNGSRKVVPLNNKKIDDVNIYIYKDSIYVVVED